MGCLAAVFKALFLGYLIYLAVLLFRRLFGAEAPAARAAQARRRYIALLMPLLAKVAKADGRISEAEIEGVVRIFRELALTEEEQALAQETFRASKATSEGWEAAAAAFARGCGNMELRVVTLQYMAQVARVDGVLSEAEVRLLVGTAQIFGIPQPLVWAILGAQGGAFWERRGERAQARPVETGQRERDLALLGLPPTASESDVKRAYRQKVKELHPDRLQAQGLPERMMAQATARMAEINAAYGRLTK